MYRFLIIVQTRNMTSNMTTSERFTKKKQSAASSSDTNNARGTGGLERISSNLNVPGSSEEELAQNQNKMNFLQNCFAMCFSFHIES